MQNTSRSNTNEIPNFCSRDRVVLCEKYRSFVAHINFGFSSSYLCLLIAILMASQWILNVKNIGNRSIKIISIISNVAREQNKKKSTRPLYRPFVYSVSFGTTKVVRLRSPENLKLS